MFFSLVFTSFYKFLQVFDKDLNYFKIKDSKFNYFIFWNGNLIDNNFTDLLIYWFILNYFLNFNIFLRKKSIKLINSYFLDTLLFFLFLSNKNSFIVDIKKINFFYEHLITLLSLILLKSNYKINFVNKTRRIA